MQSKPFYDSMILWKIMYLNISQSCQLWVQYPSEGHQREQREWENGFVKGVSPFLIQAIRITRTRWRQEKERKDICGPRWEILKCTSLQQTRNSGKKNEWGASLGAEDQWWEKHKCEFPADFFFLLWILLKWLACCHKKRCSVSREKELPALPYWDFYNCVLWKMSTAPAKNCTLLKTEWNKCWSEYLSLKIHVKA